MTRHERHLNFLTHLAADVSGAGAAKIASAIVLNNKIVSYGVNSFKTSPFQKKYGKNELAICLHSEIDAIKNALKRVDLKELSYATLYIARAKKSCKEDKFWNTQGIAKPCDGCMRAIAAFNIKKVYYTLDNNGFECL